MLMMHGIWWRRFAQRLADADDARPLKCPGLYRGRLLLMMHGLWWPRFTQKPADADDARPLVAQVYTEAG